MKTGFRGTFVISWSQTEIDGTADQCSDALEIGSGWCWRGETVRVDGPPELLRLENADEDSTDRRRAARMVHRLVGTALRDRPDPAPFDPGQPLMDVGFVVTDGAQSYTVTLIETGARGAPLLMFHNRIPPRNTEMWVVHHSLKQPRTARTGGGTDPAGGVICFTPGTLIDTPEGPRAVESLREGDAVQTKDNGAEDIQWIGQRRMTGARLFAMPTLRPIRISAAALGPIRPGRDLLVSPDHRVLIGGDVARALFNTPEVLVQARDLVNETSVSVDLGLREVSYIHLLLPRHQIVWANGVETESFHPASAELEALPEADRTRLLNLHPQLEYEPGLYGGHARRCLNTPEAAILSHEAA